MEEKKRKKRNKQIRNFAKYSGLGIQMLGIILVGTWGGKTIDEYRGAEFPLFTLILSLFAVFSAIYLGIKDFIGKEE